MGKGFPCVYVINSKRVHGLQVRWSVGATSWRKLVYSCGDLHHSPEVEGGWQGWGGAADRLNVIISRGGVWVWKRVLNWWAYCKLSPSCRPKAFMGKYSVIARLIAVSVLDFGFTVALNLVCGRLIVYDVNDTELQSGWCELPVTCCQVWQHTTYKLLESGRPALADIMSNSVFIAFKSVALLTWFVALCN